MKTVIDSFFLFFIPSKPFSIVLHLKLRDYEKIATKQKLTLEAKNRNHWLPFLL